MGLFGDSDELKGIKQSNLVNLGIAKETNETNTNIAESANNWNWANLQAQNEWNIQQWERENAYNDPSAQMERYMKAGINPLWAISNGNPGNASHLESGTPAPAEVAHVDPYFVQPEYDPNRVGKIQSVISAATNLSNSGLGFYKALLEKEDVETRKSAQKSLADLQRADIAFRKSQTIGQDLFNNLNQDTYGSIVKTKALEADQLYWQIENLRKEGRNSDAEYANLQELNKQIIAQTNYTNTLNNAKIEEVAQGWRKLSIDQVNANISYYSVESGNYWSAKNYSLNSRRFSFDMTKEAEELRLRGNDQLLKMVDQDTTWLNKFIPYSITSGIGSMLSGDQVNYDKINNSFDRLQYIGDILKSRVESEPWNKYNVDAYDEFTKRVRNLPEAPRMAPTYFAPGQSILNPSASWQ